MLDIILLIIIAILVFVIKYKTENSGKAEPETPTKINDNETLPYRKKNLFTKNEYKFYIQLKKVTAEESLVIFPKVRLEDFIETTSADQKLKYRGHIKSRHVDFLICSEKLNILAAIELDDPSHNTKKAKEVDDFKNKLYNTVGIPLHRVTTGNDYNAAIENVIKAIKSSETSVVKQPNEQ